MLVLNKKTTLLLGLLVINMHKYGGLFNSIKGKVKPTYFQTESVLNLSKNICLTENNSS